MTTFEGIVGEGSGLRSAEQDRAAVLEIVQRPDVLRRLPEPVQLAGGDWSDVFIDGKRAVADAADLALLSGVIVRAAARRGIGFDAVGGLVLGAAPFTFGVALVAGSRWFLIRKEPKGRGTNQWIEGAGLEAGTRVLLVDDVVTKGGSIQTAYRHTVEAGAQVVMATTLLDRGDVAAAFFAAEGVPYVPLLTYRDVGIDRVG